MTAEVAESAGPGPRVLVLGATGRIGAMLRRCWPPGRGLWQSRRAGDRDKPAWVVGDPLGDRRALLAAARSCDAVLGLAGVVPGQGGDPEDNITLGLAAVEIAAELGARALLTSSAAVYGNQPGLLPEGAALKPVNAYGRAKAEMEARCAARAVELGVSACALRIGNIAGVDAILGGWRPGFQLDQFGDRRTPRRSYIGLITLAEVLEALAGAEDLPGVLNIAAPGLVEMGALLDAAGLAWAARPAPDGAIAEVALDVSALQQFCRLDPGAGRPERLVAEWRSLAGAAE